MKSRGRPRYAGVLTPRQEEVIRLLAKGLTNEEIAQQLGISADGVKYHVTEILQRLGVENRHEAVSHHLRSERRGWLAAWAPITFLRKLPFAWLPKAAGGAVLTATAAGVAVLAWGVFSMQDDDGGTRHGDQTALARTGNGALDALIDLLLKRDFDGLLSEVEMSTLGCSIEQTVGSPPPCAAGMADGTPVEAFPILECEGTYATDTDEIRASFGALLSRQQSIAVYAVLRGDGMDPANGYTVALTRDVPSQATEPVSFWHVSEDGRLTGLTTDCGGAYGAAQQVEYRFSDPQYLLGPFISCSPGPGEYANVMVVVDTFSPGSIRPQFTGPAKSTLGIATGEIAVVGVSPDTDWIGAVKRLEDVRTGMELQAVGRRGANCVIEAETILSSYSVSFTDSRLGFEASYPYDWIEFAEPFPYATCSGCVTLGPRDVAYPYGIQVYATTLDPGCAPACYFTIRALPLGAPRELTIDNHSASRQEIQRQAPLGLANETGDDTPYRQLATMIRRDSDALLVVGFFREGDHAAEERTRQAYEEFLSSLRIFEAATPVAQ